MEAVRPLAALAAALLLAGCAGKLGLGASVQDPSFTVSPESGGKDTVFEVDAGRLGDKADIKWDFGDGTSATGRRADHKYGFTNGIVTITMTVTDDSGAQGTTTRTVKLGSGVNTPPTLNPGASPSWVTVGQETMLNARGSDKDGDPLTYSFAVRAQGAPEPRALPSTTARATTKFDAPGKYAILVTARDPKGGEATGETMVDVTRTKPDPNVELAWNGTILAGSAGQGVAEKVWTTPAPDTNADSARHPYTLLYPATTVIMLTWNDTSQKGAFDLDLELRDASGAAVFKSETRAPAPAFELNFTEQPAGDYVIVVRGVAGANVVYDLLLYSTLHLTPDLVAKVEDA